MFLTATGNIAGLLLSRSSRRIHETAARAALGATERRLAVHIVADSVVIATAGGALGALVAYWTSAAFPALLYSEDADRLRMTGEAGLVARAMAAIKRRPGPRKTSSRGDSSFRFCRTPRHVVESRWR